MDIDTSSPMGKAMFTITSDIAELEADLIHERVRAVLANAKAKGAKLGKPSHSLSISATTAARNVNTGAQLIITKLSFSLFSKLNLSMP